MVAIALVVILVVLVAIHASIRYSRAGRLISKIQGPFALPIVGNIPAFWTDDRVYIWKYLKEKIEKLKIVRIWFGPLAIVATRDADDLQAILTDRVNISKAHFYMHFEIVAKDGLITSTGDIWKHRRKILTPAFHPNILKKYLEVVEEQGKKFVTKLAAEGNESVQDLVPLISNVTLSVICGSAMGVDLSKLEKEAKEYKQAVSDFFDVMVYKICRPYITEWMLKFMKNGKKQRDSIKKLREFADRIIEERTKYHELNKMQTFNDYVNDVDFDDGRSGEPPKRLAMLDLLLAAKDEGLIDDEGLRAEVDTFIVAGYDTTSMALVYILMSLAENTEAQEKARAEAIKVMERCDGEMTMSDVNSLDYVERCIKESLRMLPSVPYILRTITKEMQLKDKVIPTGVQLAASIFTVHRDPDHWKDPEKYDPDRFLPENSKSRHPYAYLPFSSGPRVCIGQKFAMMELKALVARILCNFSLEPVMRTKDLDFELNIVLLPKKPVYVKFVKLKND